MKFAFPFSLYRAVLFALLIATAAQNAPGEHPAWWSQPIGEAVIPAAADRWCESPIDRFVFARLEADGIGVAADADRRTLIRRVYFALVGLPPTPAAIERFLADDRVDTYEHLVDELLASPRFGERWGRHWLDVARYADSTGGGRSLLYGTAWRYRDYVINAFNNDKPYDRFLIEQLAGDLLPFQDSQVGREQLTATAFLALGPTNYELQDKEQLRMDVVDEQIDTVGRVMLALSLGCARCHDHKFDPVSTREYYALAGVFRSTQTLIHDNVSSWVKRPLPVDSERQRLLDDHQQSVARVEAERAANQKLLAELRDRMAIVSLDDRDARLEGNWSSSASVKPFVGEGYRYSSERDARAVFDCTVEQPGEYEVRVAYTPHPNRTSAANVTIVLEDGTATERINQRRPPPIGALYAATRTVRIEESCRIEIGIAEPDGVVVVDGIELLPVERGEPVGRSLADYRTLEQRQKELGRQLEELRTRNPQPPPKVMAVTEEQQVGDYYVCVRGNVHELGEAAPRGFIAAAGGEHAKGIPEDESGRLELAQWIASGENPLTARVMVNRIWHHLFGAGLLRTVDNFGERGELPSHPELLDYLAARLVDQGWSVKAVVREIMLSHTYRLSSVAMPEAERLDPPNRLLARYPRRRLDAEAIHDAMLAISGRLDHRIGGDSVRPDTKSEYDYQFDFGRRAVYLPIFRNRLPDVLVAFDFPDPNQATGRRSVSTTSTQALLLLNSQFVREQAGGTATRLLEEFPEATAEELLDVLYLRATGRPPSAAECALALEHLAAAAEIGDDPHAAWADVCHAVLGSIFFRYTQ